ncbi:MAG: hypothetical protein ICV79_04995 [Flavisolibacter sp.]|nr:hypothetical protein [Flavisolibacter sp.]
MKLSFLSLCFSFMILLASCTKESVPPPSSSYPNDYSSALSVTASNWTSVPSLTWSDASVSTDAFIHTSWDVPQLTQEMINNDAVLIYAKTMNGDAPKLLPAMFEKTSNSEFDLYRNELEPNVIKLSHTSYMGGTYVAPSANNEVSFRYILINHIPPTNGRIITDSGLEYNLYDLKAMNYSEVVAILGITE